MYKFRCDELIFAQHDKLHRGYPQRIVRLEFEGTLPFEPESGKKISLTLAKDGFVQSMPYLVISDVWYEPDGEYFHISLETIVHYIDDFGGELFALAVMAAEAVEKAGFTVKKEPNYFYLLTGENTANGDGSYKNLDFLIPSDEQTEQLNAA